MDCERKPKKRSNGLSTLFDFFYSMFLEFTLNGFGKPLCSYKKSAFKDVVLVHAVLLKRLNISE